MGVGLQVKKGLCFCYRWSLDNRSLRKRLDAGAGVGGPAVYSLVSFGFCTACRNYLVKNKSKIVINKYLQSTNTIPCLAQYYRQA